MLIYLLNINERQIYTSVKYTILEILAYVAETRPDFVKSKMVLEAIEMQTLKKIIDAHIRDHIVANK